MSKHYYIYDKQPCEVVIKKTHADGDVTVEFVGKTRTNNRGDKIPEEITIPSFLLSLTNNWRTSLLKTENWRYSYRGLDMPVTTPIQFLLRDFENGQLDLSPPYQRDFVWTLEQKRAYIQAWLDLKVQDITIYCILNWPDFDALEKKRQSGETLSKNETASTLEVLDGKQRLSTLMDFIKNKFSIIVDGQDVFFSDLNPIDKQYFYFLNVRYYRIEKISRENLTLEEKVNLFLMLNELGTKMSDADLNKAKALLK